jgi:excinuclease ABC subunit A
MNFLPDVYVPCEVCKGARYNRETLEVHYKGRTIAEILDMPIEEAEQFFTAIPAIHRHLKTLVDVGLGYVRLGQPAPTLSGGEAQRVKLASELQKRSTGRTVYVLDEPTTGLHFEDIRKLLAVLHSLVEKGNTVIVIEHNLDVIKTADWLIEMGPEGGYKGGAVVGIGTPEEIARIEGSATGDFLRPILDIGATLAGGGEAAVRAGRANGNGNGSRANGRAKANGTRAAAEPAQAEPLTAAPAKKAAKAKAAPVKAAPVKAAKAATPAKRAPAKRTRATTA